MTLLRKFRHLNTSSAGFTLAEVLLALTVVGVVALLVAGNIQEAVAKGRDIERRNDIDALQISLETYWHAHEHYPADLLQLTPIDEDLLTDPNGEKAKILPASKADNKPASEYQTSKPEQEYTYAAYGCSDNQQSPATDADSSEQATPATASGSSQQTCKHYVLYSWLETVAEEQNPYERNNLHDSEQPSL